MNSLEEDKSGLEERLEDVLGRLKAARNSTKIEEAYRQEIRAQTKLADIYKGKISFQIPGKTYGLLTPKNTVTKKIPNY